MAIDGRARPEQVGVTCAVLPMRVATCAGHDVGLRLMTERELVWQSAYRVFNDRDPEAAGELSGTGRVIKSLDADYAIDVSGLRRITVC